MSKARVIVVAKRTPYTKYVEEERDPRAVRLLRRRDPSVAYWPEAHREHARTLESTVNVLERLGARVVVVRRAHAAFDTSDAVLVIAVGGDGTLLAASHNVGQIPILGVNSAPRYSVGFFCAASRKSLRQMLGDALENRLPKLRLTRMAVSVDGRVQSRRVLNEALFSHASPAATARYSIRYGRISEEQRSSGFWVGPAAGSTAAQHSAGGRVLPLGSKGLQLVVREPYAYFGRRYRLLSVLVKPGSELLVQSTMHDAALYLDGPYKQIPVRLGDSVKFSASEEPLTLLGLRTQRRSGVA
jgi:NAD+ kinase